MSSCFHAWTRNYTYLTGFEMVMHCLKCSGKQSSTTYANMWSPGLIIISPPKFGLFQSFQHQISELFYCASTCAIASIISVSIPPAAFCFAPPLTAAVAVITILRSGVCPLTPNKRFAFQLQNIEWAVVHPVQWTYAVLSFLSTFHLFALTHAHLIYVYPLCLHYPG